MYIHVEELVIDGNFTVVNENSWERLLPPESTTLVQLAYSPVQDEHTDGSMTVISNDRENPAVLVRLLAEGLAPAIAIEPSVFDFGNPELGCVSQLDITIANVGRAPLEIEEDGIWFEDLGGNGEMSLVHNLPDGLVLDPLSQGGSEVTVQVTLGVEKIHRSVELHATLHGQTFVSQEKRGDMYEAIDVCVDKLNRQISRKKSKLKHHKGQQPTSPQIITR